MSDIQTIKRYLSVFKDLPPAILFSIIKVAQPRKLSAGETYIHEGELSSKIAYIRDGMIRAYQVNDRGEEITLLVRWEDQIIASHENIIFKRPSRFSYQAIEASTILEADYSTIEGILDKNPKFEKLRYHFLLHMLAEALFKVESFILMSPEERYQQLVKDKPDLIQRVPVKHLATLLGITPVSLSRIRKRISRN
jgi:CRP-like cAMP-binding protein